MEQSFITKNDLYMNEMVRLQTLLDMKINVENTLLQVIFFLQNLLKDGNSEEFKKYGNNLLYYLINYVEKEQYPNLYIISQFLDFILKKMMYLEQPFWFIGIGLSLSKGIYKNILFKHPKFMITMKTIYHCFGKNFGIRDPIIEIYLNYLNNISDSVNLNSEYDNMAYFFRPLIGEFEMSKDLYNLEQLIVCFEKKEKCKNRGNILKKISSKLKPLYKFDKLVKSL